MDALDLARATGSSLPHNQGGKYMIRHTVVFTLKHAKGSPDEQKFLADALVLNTIPGVEKFERLKQVSPKNNYSFGFSMEFADQAAYDGYNVHPLHVAFVRERWMVEVADFMEIDYVVM
jgi:Stress responsive A/B Barrel Domain